MRTIIVVTSKKCILFGIFVLASLIGFLVSNLLFLSYMSSIQFVCLLLLMREKGFSIVSFPVICFVTTFMFHMFTVIFASITNDISILQKSFWNNDTVYIAKAVHLYIGETFFFGIGCEISKKKRIKKRKTISNQSLILIGAALIVIGIIPKLSINYSQLLASQQKGYLNSYTINLAGRGTLATFVYSGIMILLFAFRDKKVICSCIFLISALYEMIFMFSGNRYMSLSLLICMFLIYFRCVNKKNRVKAGQIFIVVFIAFVGVAFLNTIREIRLNSGSVNMFMEVFLYQLKNNPIISLGLEMGGTMNTVILSIERFPASIDYAWGKTFTSFILSVFKLNSDAQRNYLYYIYNFSAHESLGGSFIGELYYNFSYLGAVGGIIFGVITAKIEYMFEEIERNRFSAILTFPLMLYSFSYIRGYFDAYRIAIYHIVVIFILERMLKKVYFRNTCENAKQY